MRHTTASQSSFARQTAQVMEPISLPPKPSTPATSWWVGLSREAFAAAIAREQDRMSASKVVALHKVSKEAWDLHR